LRLPPRGQSNRGVRNEEGRNLGRGHAIVNLCLYPYPWRQVAPAVFRVVVFVVYHFGRPWLLDTLMNGEQGVGGSIHERNVGHAS